MRDAGPFRPLRSLVEADRSLFFGRDRELAELIDRVNGDHGSVVLLGEVGIGKTSLVRAGLLPHLKSRGTTCTYVDCTQLQGVSLSTGGPAGSLLVLDNLGAALDGGARLEPLLALLKKASGLRAVKTLFVLDDGDLWRLDGLEKRVGSLGATARLRLERFDEARATDVIERTVLAGGGYFESGLSLRIAADLARRGAISPSEMQLVAATALALRLTTARAYARSGGSEVIIWRYLDLACKLAGGRKAARALAEIASLEPRQASSVQAIARVADVSEASAQAIATALSENNLVRAVDSGFVLGNEWVRTPVRAFTGESRGRWLGARLVLRQHIESGGLLSPGELRDIRRYAGALNPDEERVVRKSQRTGLVASAAILGVPLLALLILYVGYVRTCYLDVSAGPGGSIVARLGRPAGTLRFLPHWPRFGAVIADSGFARAALKDKLPSGPIARSGSDWMRRLLGALRPLPQGVVALVIDDDLQVLTQAYESPIIRPAIIDAVGAAGKASAQELALVGRALTDPTEELRRHAVSAAAALERRSAGSATAMLRMALKDVSPSLRALAMSEICRLPDDQATPILVAALADTSDPAVRRVALDTIAKQAARSPAAVASLGRALLGPARNEASSLLGKLIDGEGPSAAAAQQTLAQLALDGHAPDDARIDALRMLRRPSTTPAQLETITGSPRVMAAAMPLQLRLRPDDAAAKVLEALKGPLPMRAAAAASIGLLPKTTDTIRQLKMLEYDPAAEVRVEAIRSVVVLGRDALPILAKEAKDGGAEVERAAVETLGLQAAKLGVSTVVSMLAAVVKTARPSTRRAAIDALGRIAEAKPSVAAGTLGFLVHDKISEVRAEAASALGEVLSNGGREAIVPLRGAARDPDPATRRRAAGALGRAKGILVPSAAKALQSLLGDPDPSVRLEVATSLEALAPEARDLGSLLVSLIGDSDASVRAAGRKAARRIGKSAGDLDHPLYVAFGAATPLDKVDIVTTAGVVGAATTVRAALADSDARVRRAAAENAGGLGPSGVAGLLGALGDKDMSVRVAAVRGLVGARAVSALAQAAGSPDLEVRTAALEAIGEVEGPSALAVLGGAMNDGSERVRVAAATGLGKLGHAATDLLERALGNPARDVREAACAGLGVAWKEDPISDLTARLHDESKADARYAAGLALARRADSDRDSEAKRALDEVSNHGGPASRLTARVARAFIGRPDEMSAFIHLLRNGG